MDTTYKNIAVLVDGDNSQESKMQSVIEKISTYGRISVKRIYGNWKKENLKNWEDTIKNFAFKAQQQFDYVKKKNATDMALVVDAMELLYTGRYDAFVIVAADSDYTPLTIKLKEMGIFVVGVGNKDASEAFKRSCDDFIYIETLPDKDAKKEDAPQGNAPNNSKEKHAEQTSVFNTQITAKDLNNLLKTVAAEESYQDDEGFVNVSSAGSYIKRVHPDFDIKQFGFSKLPNFLDAHKELYETKRYKGKGKVTIIAYRCR